MLGGVDCRDTDLPADQREAAIFTVVAHSMADSAQLAGMATRAYALLRVEQRERREIRWGHQVRCGE